MFNIQSNGSIHNYAKMMKMENQWRQKQKSGDYTSKTDTLAKTGKQFADSIMPERNDTDDRKMQEIRNKMNMGSSLTSDELEHLKKESPELYEKYIQAENERKQEEKAYKAALKRCRTKEEVQRLKMSALGKSLNTVNFVKNNPNIPEDKKLEIITKEQRKVDDVNENTQKFIESGKYAELPTDREQVQADNEALEELCPRTEEAEQVTSENTDETIPAEKSAENAADKNEEDIPDFYAMEAERKVRLARIRAAYTEFSPKDDEDIPNSWSVEI